MRSVLTSGVEEQMEDGFEEQTKEDENGFEK